jgi:PAS domain S-box-containing protein
MWDMATPIIAGGQHVGYVFSGQFFFEDEPLDYELFRFQAKKYGFNEKEYIAALEKVPRLSRESVETGMSFLMTFANMTAQLSYSNIKLAQSLEERDELVEALQESEKRERVRSEELEAVLDAVPVAVFIAHDPQVLQINGNRLSYEWLRVPVGTNFSKSAPEEERPKMFELFKDGVEIPPEKMPSQLSAAGIEVNNCELDIVFANGEMLHVLGNARPLRDEQGNPRGSVSAFIDITERKQAEEALRLSNIYNRSLIEASLDPLVTIGPEGKITDVNSSTETVTGYSRDELVGTDFSDYFTEPYKARKGYQQAFKLGEIKDYPLEIQHKDGHITPVFYNASVYKDETGKIIGVFAAARDITERKKSEKALKKVHDNLEKIVEERTSELEKAYNSLKESEKSLSEAQKMAHIGNWNWNLVTGEVYWSNELYCIFGRSPQELSATYDEFLSYVHPDDRDRVNNAMKKGLNGGPIAGDYRIILANGEERIVHTESEVVFYEENNPIQVKGTVQDITERKKVEETLKKLEVIRKKEIHHRIKNNLQVISSLLDLQAEKFNNRECVKDSEIIEAFKESQDRVTSIALIHEELHEEEGTTDTLNFSLYLQRLAESLFQTYRFGNTKICLNLDLEESIFFDMDTAVPLGMIVNELVSNSFKYAFTGRKTGEIQIKLFRKEITSEINSKEELTQKGTKYTLIVSDNGTGIPKNIDFENPDTLGLQLVSILVDQLEGKIKFERDQGTEFTIWFNDIEK